MSYFAIQVKKIEKVWKHPDANAMQMAKVEGYAYQSVVGLNVKPGDLVVYFPVESIISERIQKMLPEIIAKKLGGTTQNRVVTVRLRGQLSQGLAIPVENFKLPGNDWKVDGCDLTKKLGIVKYNAPIVEVPNAKLAKLPVFCPEYDIQSCDVFEAIFDKLKGEEVVITEKLEGTNHATSSGDGIGLSICQRCYEVFPDEGKMLENPYWRAAHEQEYDKKAATMSAALGQIVTIRSELIGNNKQFKNYYELSKLELYTFDVWLNGLPIDFDREQKLVKEWGLQYAPILHRGILHDILKGQSIRDFSNGMSKINSKKRREGIVIRPVREQTHSQIGRLILKQHSPEYKLKVKQ